jgi:hypothetical protein
MWLLQELQPLLSNRHCWQLLLQGPYLRLHLPQQACTCTLYSGNSSRGSSRASKRCDHICA